MGGPSFLKGVFLVMFSKWICKKKTFINSASTNPHNSLWHQVMRRIFSASLFHSVHSVLLIHSYVFLTQYSVSSDYLELTLQTEAKIIYPKKKKKSYYLSTTLVCYCPNPGKEQKLLSNQNKQLLEIHSQ